MRRYINYGRKKRKFEVIYEGRVKKNDRYDIVVQLILFKPSNALVFSLREYQKLGDYVGFLSGRGYSVTAENYALVFPELEEAMKILKDSGYLKSLKNLSLQESDESVDSEDNPT